MGFHSYDPGISQTLVVWVAAVSNGSAHVDLDRGEASFRARNIGVLDAFTVENSLTPARTLGNPVAAQIDSLEIKWSGIFRRVAFSSSAEKFAGNYVENAVTIEVTMTTLGSTGHGFRFVSNPASTTLSHFAQIGRERNGKFYG